MSTPASRRDPTVRQLRQELDLVESAIQLVASGRATRVRLASLTFGELLLEQARRMASAAGLQVTPLWTASDCGIVDLDVDRPGLGNEGDAQS